MTALGEACGAEGGADELVQALILALLTSEIRSPHAEIAFISEFVHQATDTSGHVTAIQPPCNRHATAMQPPCNRHVTAM